MKICKNCGSENNDEALFCGKCGSKLDIEPSDAAGSETADIAPEETAAGLSEIDPAAAGASGTENEQKDKPAEVHENTGGGKKKKGWIILIIALIAVFAIAASIFGIKIHNDKVKEQYAADLNLLSVMSIEGAASAEEQGNLTLQVWYGAIWGDPDKEVKKYVDGTSDFNDALENLYESDEFIEKTEDLTSNKDVVDDIMEDLKNPPDEYMHCYEIALELYGKYNTMITLATEPDGSYNSYSEEFNIADEEYLEIYNKFTAAIPDME